MRLKFFPAWERASKQLNHICNTLSTHSRITSGTAKSHQESNMTTDAIADCAKARQVNEKPLLKDRTVEDCRGTQLLRIPTISQ